MNCPFCSHPDNRVVDSRDIRSGVEIRRRRECAECGQRFTTYERVDELPTTVVKRDGRRESFDREKLLNGLLRACEKRPVPRRDLVAVVDSVESALAAREVREMSTEEIGKSRHRGASTSRPGRLRAICQRLPALRGRDPVHGRAQDPADSARRLKTYDERFSSAEPLISGEKDHSADGRLSRNP